MEQDKLEIEKQLLQIHYYFTDESHSMDAFVRNAMEKDLLNLINEIANILDIKIKVENQARDEGGLKENIIILIVGAFSYFAPTINNFATFYATGQNKIQKLDLRIKEEEIRKIENQNEQDDVKIQEIKNEYIGKMEENHKIYRLVSNFYNKAEKCEKIEKIGYKTANQSEFVVERNKFKTFILTENKDIELIENAEIEIISPVLKEDTYKWKGIYNGNKIDFSMGDSGFKNDVITQKHNFINGTSIICDLEISRTFDEYGEEVKISYRVKKVVGIRIGEVLKLTKLGKKIKRQKQIDNEPTLFDFMTDNHKEQ